MKSFADLYDNNETIKQKGRPRYSSFADLYDFTSPQAEPEKDSGGILDTANNAVDWWKNNSLAGAGFLGGLLTETAGNAAKSLGENFGEDTWRRRALEGVGDIAQNAADKMLDFATNRVDVANGDNFSGAIGNSFMSGETGSLSGLASMIHADKTADALMKAAESTANKNRVSTDDLGEYFTNPHGFVSDFGQQAGSMAAIAPAMALLPEAAALRGLSALGGDAITQALINRGMYNAAKFFAGGAPQAVRYGLTSTPIEGAMEGGETRRNLLNQGASEEEATKESLITMGKNIPLLLATNTLEGLALLSPLKGANKALQIGGRAGLNSAQQQYEEFAQEGIQNAALGKPYSWLPWEGASNQYEAAERVRYPALFTGGIGGAAQVLGGMNENQKNYERGYQENISNENYSARAQKSANQLALNNFMRAIGQQESDGNYDLTNTDSGAAGKFQIMPDNWSSWARDAGLSPNAPMTPENQELAAKNKMQEYYNKFGNWRDVAIAWYGGEGAVAYSEEVKNRPQYSNGNRYPSINEYADSVMARFATFGDEESKGQVGEIDFAAGLQSARKALDGKQMDNGTVGCVEAVTKILSHVHPEFKKMVDDGVVNTVEGENSLHSRLEKMGVEIIPFDESKVAQGDIIFYDGKQTYQHVLVADHKDADGNWRVFGNSSSANKVMEQPLYQGQTPSWIAKVSNLQGSNSSQIQNQQQKNTKQEESTKPPFDINAEDETTQKLLDKFANERFNEAINNEDEETIKFFDGMFNDKDAFQNTSENRNAIIERYSEELSKFIQDNAPTETQAQTQSTAQPATNTSTVKQADNPYQKNAAIKTTANNFLEQLRAEGYPNKGATLFRLQNALNKGNFTEVENILKQNGIKISQPQQDPVKENKPPENVLSQPANTSGNEKLIKAASKAVTKKTSHEGKKKIGNAILQLANQNGIAVPTVDFKSLQNGSSKKIAEWQAKLSQAGAFAISSPQTSASNKPSANETIESKTAEGTTVFTPQSVIQAEEQKKNSLKYRAQQVLNKLSAQHTQNVLREREADLSNDETDETVPFNYSNYVNDAETPTPAELQRQENEKVVQKYQAQQEKKRQERAEFDAAVKKDSENNYGLRADEARRRRERYEATRVDPITARGNAISDAREDEETLRDAERRENEEAQQVSPETLRENYARAQYLGDFDTNERLETMREEGRKQRDLEIEQLKTANRDARKAAGKEVLRTLRNPKYNTVKSKVDATSGLSTALENGSVEAIRQVRNLIAEVDNQELQERQRQSEEQLPPNEARQEEEQRRNGTQTQIQPQVQPTPVQQPSEVRAPESVPQDNEQTPSGRINLESQTKEKSKGKWHTVGSAGSREDLQQSIREHYHNGNLVIEDDGTIVDYETGEVLSNVVRNKKGRWQFGRYENEQPKQSTTPQQTQKIQPVQKNNRYGNTAEVITGSRTQHQVKYKVVEASELNSSHVIDNGSVFANKNYPSELQPRNRERANMQAQLISMSNNLNPADLMDARDVNQGAPVVRNDGVVLNGNGRTAAISYAYKNGKGDNYKNALIENAQRLGLNADEISKMNQPVLVRELANDLAAEDLQDITTTQTGGARMGASEQAQSDARKLSANTLALFPQNDNADLTNAEANDFLQSALRDIATPDELNSLTTSDGRINQDGINRVNRALFALAYDDGGLISRMSESTDDNVRGATNALLTAAPAIAKVRAGMKNGTLHKYDLSAIADAVKKLSALRDQNKPVANYLQEQSLFGEDSAEMKEILSALDRYKRAPNKIAAFLKKTASNIQEQGDPRQGSLFGESEPAPLIDLIKQARQEVENNGQTMPMFSLNGEVDTTIDNFVEDKDLTPQQKLLKSFGEMLGVETVFFRNEDGDFHGAHSGNVSYVNVNSNKPLDKVFWHEILHWLKANNPKLYQRLVEAAGITDAQRDAYLKETERTDLVTDEAIDEEILADKMEDVAQRSGLLQSIAGKNRGLIQRVVQWLKDTMNKFIDHFRNPSGKLTTKQSIALADEFGKIAKDLVDPNGQKIFRYNNRTKNIELANGRSLDSLQDDEETKYSFAGRKAKTADKESLKRAKQMEKRGANRDEIYEATGWFKGRDNKWRFEIPDNFDKIDFDKLWRNEETQFPLDEIYDNLALFAAYPKLRKVLVRSKQLKSPELYGYTNGTEITLNWSKIDDERENAGETLVHEIQHVIQDYEIFSSGGSDNNVLSEMLRNLKLIRKEVATIPNGKKSLKPLSEAFSAARFAREMGEDEAELLQDADDTIRIIKKGFSPKNWEKMQYLASRYSELSDTVDNIRDAKGETMIVDTDDGEIEEPLQPRLKYEAYERLGGEQEAREVGRRLFDNDGTPTPHDDDALIIFGGETYGMIKQSKNKKRPPINGDRELVKDGAMRENFPPSAATADGTTDYWSPASLKVTRDNKGGVGTSGNSVDTNSPSGSISQGRQDSNIKYSFAGKKAKTADKDSLNRAMAMDERGANRDQIYRDTGWVKGKDNKWRFEIPDNLDKINFGKLARDGKATLVEIYFNPKLYAAYPQLKNMCVAVSNEMKSSGQFNPSTNTIKLNKEVVDILPDKAKQTLVHELQHAIQNIEGFAFGDGKSNSNYENLGGEQEAREVAARAVKQTKTTPIIHDENAVIIFNDKKHAVKTNQRETPNRIAYSIGNDNSSESLIDKIKNKLSWFGGDKKTIRRKKVITAKLRELSGYRILYGNVKGANDIVVDHLQKLIQSRNTYDWNKLLPVVSKEIAKNLKLNTTAEQSNLIADWLLTGALNNTSAEMKAFQKAMRDNPAMADILLETRNLFQEIADMPADEQISSSLVDLKSKPFFEGDFTEEVLDDLSPLQKIVDTAIKNVPPEVAELIKRMVNPKQLAQLSRGSGEIANIMINGKASELEKIRATLSEKYTGVYFDKFKPLTTITQSVGGDWKGLQTYAVAKLSKEMYEYNRAHPELKEPLIPYTTEAAADATIKQGEAKFGEAQKDLVIYSKILLAMEHDSGLITDNTFYRVLKSWKNYVPMAQVFDENEDYTKLDYLKRRKGHEGDSWSPIQIMMANTHRRIQACERNKVKLELANLVRFGGFDSNLSEVESPIPNVDNIIYFRENGKRKALETPDPAIKRAVDSLQSKSDGTWITKMLRAITSFMRMRLTGGNLDFAAGNPFRDLPDAYIHNNQQGKDVFIIGDFMRAWGSAVKELIQDARGKGMSQAKA